MFNKNFSLSILFKLIGISSTLIFSIILSNKLNSNEFGLYEYVMRFTAIILSLIIVGFPQLLLKNYASENDSKNREVLNFTAFCTSLVVFIVTLPIALFFLLDKIENNISFLTISLLLVSVLLLGISRFLSSIINSSQKTWQSIFLVKVSIKF